MWKLWETAVDRFRQFGVKRAALEICPFGVFHVLFNSAAKRAGMVGRAAHFFPAVAHRLGQKRREAANETICQ